jgi:hypothetical protein
MGLVSLDHLKRTPNMYGVLATRHKLKPGKDLPSKEDMPELVAWHLNIDFPYEYTKKGKLEKFNYDRSDAVAVALMHAMSLGGVTNPKGEPPKMTPKVKKVKTSKSKNKKNEYKRSL